MESLAELTCSAMRRNERGLGNVGSVAPSPCECIGHLNVNTQPCGMISSTCCRISPHRHKAYTLWDRVNSSLLRTVFLLGLLFLPTVTGQLGLQPSDSTPGNPPTVFTQQPLSGSPEIQGNTKVLLCQATGHPPPVYRWKKDGRFLSSINTTETSYKIMNINRSNAGEYQCIASNTHGAILSNSVNVVVAYMIPFPSSGSMDRTVDQGQAHVINLPPIESVPEPSIHWFEFGSDRTNAIPAETQRYHITLRNQLVILESRSSDNNKMYQVRAQNSYTGQISDSQRYVFNVQNVGSPSSEIPPSVVIPPSNTIAIQGEDVSVTLECVANARSLNYLTINWYRVTSSERTLLKPDIKYLFSLYRRRLTIKLPVTTDTGQYECEAAFNRPGGPKFPTASATANLTVLVKPSFATPPPAELVKDYGSNVEIPCQAVGTPGPEVEWYYNTRSISDLGDSRMKVSRTGRLSITGVTPVDSGVYQCFVRNDAGEINAATWLRVVSSPPEITTAPANKTAIAGDAVQLKCSVTGAPKPDVVWYRVTSQGSEDLPGTSGRIQVFEKELLISVSDVLDSGKYVCNATNSKGNEYATAHVKVLLRTRITNPPQTASVIKGSNHMLLCRIAVDPQVIAIWTWRQNTQKIPVGDMRRQIMPDGTLLLKAVRNEDIGNYTCRVTSAAGDDVGTASLKVIELPYPPSITVSLNAESNRAVDVQWQPGFDGNSPIRRFIVQHRMEPLDSQGWQVADGNVQPSERTYTVQGLQPARQYVFRVSAVNDVGEGQPSDVSPILEMPQQPPSGPPRGVVGSPRSESSIIIQWQQPDEDKWNGPLKGYMVRYKPSGYPDSTLTYENITSHLVLMYELSGLIVFTEYEISVAAYNSEGVGVFSDTIQVRTQEGIPTQAPRNLDGRAVSSTSIKLEWLPPDPQYINGINQGYKVEATRVNTPEPEVSMTIPSNTSNMLGTQLSIIQHLRKFSEYSITILCFTSKGEGPRGSAIQVKTMEDVPDQVGSIVFDDILDTSLLVIWTPPENINGILTGYQLSYMKKDETISKVTKVLGPLTLNYTITGLTATTTYTIEVLATTRVGSGVPRTADIESGVPPVRPEAPRNLAITNIQARSVLLQFVPGFSGHTSISKWVIEGQINANADWEKVFEKIDPTATSITVEDLNPYTTYVLRLVAVNVAGDSDPSESTRQFQTIQAPPTSPPPEVTVRAINETAIRVRWKPLASDLWNGEGRGYMIQYKVSDEPLFVTTLEVQDANANSHTFTGLEEWMPYDFRVASFNKVGNSAYSPIASDRTRESVPSEGPREINVTALSSTSVKVAFSEIPTNAQNGLIRGYKVYSNALDGTMESDYVQINKSDTRVVVLSKMKKYTRYTIQVRGYTRIGEGQLSNPARVIRTFEDVPGPPSNVYFSEVTHTTCRIAWAPPTEPNGVLLGYRITYREKSKPLSFTVVDDNLGPNTHEYYVANLQRTTFYVFHVVARTQLGWGAPTIVELYTVVNRRIPDAPSQPQVGGSQVGARWVTLNWQPGGDGYGPIRNFTLQMKKLSTGDRQRRQAQGDDDGFLDLPDYIMPNQTSHTVKNLKPNSHYQFRIAANNDLGASSYSQPSEVVITKQAPPDSPPLHLEVVPKTITSVLVSWKRPPKDTWNGKLRGYRIQYRQYLGGTDWRSESVFNGNTVAFELKGYNMFSYYEFRVCAMNSVGQSRWSPSYVMYMEPPSEESWNGNQLGYQVWYSQLAQVQQDSTNYQQVTVAYPTTSVELTNLIQDLYYEVKVNAFNNKGHGPFSRPHDVYVGEAVPTEAPNNFKADALSATEISVAWDPPAVESWNGDLLGYKIFYWVQESDEVKQVKTVAATETKTLLESLDMFTQYNLIMLAFNAAGDGPNTTVIIAARTHEGVPSQPSNLVIVMTSPDKVNISWAPPLTSNGIILLYEVSYYQVKDAANGESLRVQVELPGDKHSYEVGGLESGIMYVFSVRAKTAVDWGAAKFGNLTTGPQPGSPSRPGKPTLKSGDSLVTITWANGEERDNPVIGYIIQNRQKNGIEWKHLMRTNTAEPTALVSFNNLNPNTEYQFRVIAINSQGISEPSEASDMLETLVIENKPFYQQWWFLVIVALTGLIFIIIVISLLCLTGRKRRKKTPSFPDAHIPKTTIRLDENGTVDEAGFSTFEMRRSQRAQSQRKPPKPSVLPPYTSNYSSASRDGISDNYLPSYQAAAASANGHLPVRRKSQRTPPRPSPGSVNYSDEDAKTYADEEENSSLTEKPSDLSSSGSEDQASDSEPESEKDLPPPAFTNHYVNGDVQQSWQRHRSPSNLYAYTDSEHDSNYAVTLNGGHIIMNNMAGSRAPLPGFSSFV